MPGALRISIAEKEDTAQAIVAQLKKAGVSITAAEARKIVDEIAAHPNELKSALQQLRQAFEGIRAE